MNSPQPEQVGQSIRAAGFGLMFGFQVRLCAGLEIKVIPNYVLVNTQLRPVTKRHKKAARRRLVLRFATGYGVGAAMGSRFSSKLPV